MERVNMIRILEKKDMDVWLEIAAEVQSLFGPMIDNPEFHQAIEKCIDEKEVMGVCNESGNVEGIVAISKTENEIIWLAVRNRSRGRGYGEALIKKAIEMLDSNRPIFVQTFSKGHALGDISRRLYSKFGFIDEKKAGKNPAGIDTVIMKL